MIPALGTLASVTKDLASLIVEASAYNPETQYVNMDRLWEDPRRSAQFSARLVDALRLLLPIPSVKGILAVDTVSPPFGLIPIAVQVAGSLGLPLAVWKEHDNPITGSHKVYGSAAPEHSLMLYDVARFGLTALRAIGDLQMNGIRTGWFVTIVDCEQGALKQIEEGANVQLGLSVEARAVLRLSQVVSAAGDAERKQA